MSLQNLTSAPFSPRRGFLKRCGAMTMLAAATLAVAPAATADEATPLAGSPSTVTPLERVSSYVDPAIVRLTVDFSGKVWDRNTDEYLFGGDSVTLRFSCTGYAVTSDGYIATAGHCVDPNGADVAAAFEEAAVAWEIKHDYYLPKYSASEISANVDYFVDGTEKLGEPDVEVTAQLSSTVSGGETYTADVIDYTSFEHSDAALVKISATNLQALPLSEDEDLGIGTEVVSIGFAGSVDQATGVDQKASYKEGSISSQPTTNAEGASSYEISAAMSGGMSGGPTVNLDGEVIGFNSFGVSGETQQFNFIRPASAMAKLMKKAGVDNDLGEVGREYRDGLDAYFSGDKSAATTALQAVLDAQPSNTVARDFLEKAEQLADPVTATPAEPAQSPVPFGSRLIPFGAGVVGLVLVAGAVVLVRARRTSPPSTTHTTPFLPATGGSPMPTPAFPDATTVMAPTPARATAGMAMAPAGTGPSPLATTFGSAESHAAQGLPVQDHGFCTGCGTPAPAGHRYCKGCGSALS